MKQDSLLRSTTLFSLATLASRFLGLARDSCIAAFIPIAWQDIFWAGIKIPSTFRQLFAEGALSAAFIPLLTRVREREGEANTRQVGLAVLYLLIFSVLGVILLSIFFAPWFVPWILDFPPDQVFLPVPGFSPAQLVIPVSLDISWRVFAGVQVTQIMFPFLLFIALSAWAMGVLNTYRYFFMPALASAFFNLSLIAGCLIGPFYFGGMKLMWFMGGAVIFGGFLQFFVQIPHTWKIRFFPPHWVSPFHPKIKDFLRLLAPSAFGLAIYQINALITQTYFASKYGEGGISTMQYAFRLIQFPLGVIGVALATASFPRIAQQIEQKKRDEATQTLIQVTKYLLLLMIPAAIGLIVLGKDIVGAIYDRREFHENELLVPTYAVLVAYCFGLFSFAFLKVLVRTFQAHHDFATPVKIGALSVLLNIVLCAVFVRSLPLWSLGLASAIASTVHSLFLLILLKRKMDFFHFSPLLHFAWRVMLASAGMAGGCIAFLMFSPIEGGTLLTYAFRVCAGMLIGLFVYGGLGWFLFPQEIKAVLKLK